MSSSSLTDLDKTCLPELAPGLPANITLLTIPEDTLNLKGSPEADWIMGNERGNRINGSGGADTMQGLSGNDAYLIDNSEDVVVETPDAGVDWIITPLSYALPDDVENLWLAGTDNASALGNALNNRFISNRGDNRLDGAGGMDTVSYYHAPQAVVVSLATEARQATGGGGNDTLIAIENLVGSSYADSLSGNAGNNILRGNAGNDTLTGGAGDDLLIGGAGNDCLVLSEPDGFARIRDFTPGFDRICIDQNRLPVGNGDTVFDHPAFVAGLASFSPRAEWVRFSNQINGRLTAESAAALIGTSAQWPFVNGHHAIFVVNNGVNSGIFYFTALNANNWVSAAELTLIGIASGVGLEPGDFVLA